MFILSCFFPNPGAARQQEIHTHIQSVESQTKRQKIITELSQLGQDSQPKVDGSQGERKSSGDEKECTSSRKRKGTGELLEPAVKVQRNAKTRFRVSNRKKRSLLIEFDQLRKQHPLDFQARFEARNPSLPLSTFNRWRWNKIVREQIMQDGISATPAIRNAKISGKGLDAIRKALYPEQETKVYDLYGVRRLEGKIVSNFWITRQMLKILKEDKPDGWRTFKASNRWSTNFSARFQMSRRRTTNVKGKSATERLPKVQKFHRVVREFREPPPTQDEKYGRFSAINTFHMDQVPCEFGSVGAYTLDQKDAKVVHVKTAKKDMHRRLATLQLCFNAGDKPRVDPAIIFRAVPKQLANGKVNNSLPQSHRLKPERKKYAKGVRVLYQPKAWADTSVSLKWASIFAEQTGSPQEKLLGLDNLGSQCNPVFKNFIREKADALLIYTPAGCTDLCAVTDFGLGKAIKDRMKKKFLDDFQSDQYFDRWVDGDVSASELRVLLVRWLAESWKEFFASGGQEQVNKAFKRCGMLNAIDGSEDSEIRVQGVENYKIGESESEECETEESESEECEIEESESEECDTEGSEAEESEAEESKSEEPETEDNNL